MKEVIATIGGQYGHALTNTEIVRCKDCAKSGSINCPMYHAYGETVTEEAYDLTRPDGFCDRGKWK